jgi:hypothetical protein
MKIQETNFLSPSQSSASASDRFQFSNSLSTTTTTITLFVMYVRPKDQFPVTTWLLCWSEARKSYMKFWTESVHWHTHLYQNPFSHEPWLWVVNWNLNYSCSLQHKNNYLLGTSSLSQRFHTDSTWTKHEHGYKCLVQVVWQCVYDYDSCWGKSSGLICVTAGSHVLPCQPTPYART